MKLSDNHASLRLAGRNMTPNMNSVSAIVALAALAILGSVPRPAFAAEEDGVALAIIYDTSGSMRETVPDQNGKPLSKYIIANRALVAIAKQIQTFATNTGTGAPRRVDAGLFVFSGDSARQAVPFGPFDPKAVQDFARHFSNPNGNTPLGNSLALAAQAVLESPLPRKHVLLITDGMNTAGPRPESVLPALQRKAGEKGAALSVHFVAFDVDAKVFDKVKKQGATVVAAANEKQLASQLEFIMQKKILLEEEEPPKKK